MEGKAQKKVMGSTQHKLYLVYACDEIRDTLIMKSRYVQHSMTMYFNDNNYPRLKNRL